MSKIKADELAELFSDFVNSYDRDKNVDFIQAYTKQHRTLQQSGFGLILQLIEHMASDAYNTDGRNEDSKKVAKDLLKGFRIVKKEQFVEQGLSLEEAEKQMSSEFASKPSKYLGFI